MGRRDRKITPKKIDEWIAEGRGQGRGSEYKPWLTTLDVALESFTLNVKGWKSSGRQYELFSILEANYAKTLDWEANVVEFREQFPLLPLEETQNIADKLGFKHPNFQGEPIVMTTDFLISVQEKIGISERARTVKPSERLEDPRVIEKFEIERHYWENRGIDWGIVTERDIPKTFLKNVSWIYHRFYLEDVGLSEREINRVANLLTKWMGEKSKPLSEICADCDDQLGLDPGNSLSVVRHLIAQRRWLVDMHELIEPSKQLILLSSKL